MNDHPEGCSCGSPECPQWQAEQGPAPWQIEGPDYCDFPPPDEYDAEAVDEMDRQTNAGYDKLAGGWIG